ncbi:MAG: diaminopimelate decarboxylase [Treponemataceae bacterium]|nr:MAG: diaminopimelate decarboxylase [Treponemataceae bacterium]
MNPVQNPASRYFPLDNEQLEKLSDAYGTPFYLYDEAAIRRNMQKFTQAFAGTKDAPLFDFREYFAVKACPNPYILQILASEGCGADCSSLPELILAQKSGICGKHIMFSSNETPREEYKKAHELGAIINLDDITHIDFLERTLGEIPETICFRYNPGALKSGNAIIGKPEEAKYGLTREQLFDAYSEVQKRGSKHFGLHTMVASNELNEEYFVETARIVFELVAEISEKLNIHFDFVDLGGGIGIPYRPEQQAVDYARLAAKIKTEYDAIIATAGLAPLALYWECGRPITGPFGYLVTRAIHEKHIYRDYIGVDASMADLMRPGMYGAYHEITVSGKENAPKTHVYDVVGSLCENCDKFAVQRKLPQIKTEFAHDDENRNGNQGGNRGDLLIIHDVGAHGRAMGFNYNGKLRAGELLLKSDKSVKLIRRRETIEDYFATLDFSSL